MRLSNCSALLFFSISKAFTEKETKPSLNLPTKMNSFFFVFLFFCSKCYDLKNGCRLRYQKSQKNI